MKDIFLGLAIFGSSIGLRDPSTAAMMLTGRYDETLLKTFFWVTYKREPINEEHRTNAECIQMLKIAKERVRNDIQYVFRMAEAEEQESRGKAFDELRNQLRTSNRPHGLGTVAEIATRYGISKSEVRRRKSAGATLASHFTAEVFPA
jgi:hypothetical protein